MKTFVVGTHWKHLVETLPMSAHNICFLGEIKKLENWTPLSSRALYIMNDSPPMEDYTRPNNTSLKATVYGSSAVPCKKIPNEH